MRCIMSLPLWKAISSLDMCESNLNRSRKRSQAQVLLGTQLPQGTHHLYIEII